jgi:hypothetical protein
MPLPLLQKPANAAHAHAGGNFIKLRLLLWA